jgi:hypothetical protein
MLQLNRCHGQYSWARGPGRHTRHPEHIRTDLISLFSQFRNKDIFVSWFVSCWLVRRLALHLYKQQLDRSHRHRVFQNRHSLSCICCLDGAASAMVPPRRPGQWPRSFISSSSNSEVLPPPIQPLSPTCDNRTPQNGLGQ